MSFENIQLPVSLLQDLYKDMLIDITPEVSEKSTVSPDQIMFLGKNNKNILVLVDEHEVPYLNDPDLNFLVGVLGACKLSMADVALVNFNTFNNFQKITEQLNPQIFLLFGIKQDKLGLPLNFPQYQVQQYNSKIYLSAPTLKELIANKQQKQQLWDSLKKIFTL